MLGLNGAGQLGIGTVDSPRRQRWRDGRQPPGGEPRSRPHRAAVSKGGAHACALLDNGAVKCWGDNGYGQLGQGDVDTAAGSRPTWATASLLSPSEPDGPPPPSPSATTAAAPASTTETSSAGDATTLANSGPVTPWTGATNRARWARTCRPWRSEGRTVTAIVRGVHHSCAILDDGTLKCWGDGFWGNLGLGNKDNVGEVPSEMGDGLPTVDVGTGRTVGLATRVNVAVSAPAPVLVGGTLSYDITVTNTGVSPHGGPSGLRRRSGLRTTGRRPRPRGSGDVVV